MGSHRSRSSCGSFTVRSWRYSVIVRRQVMHRRLLRSPVVLGATGATVIVLLATATAAAAARSERAQARTIASYCSSSGDICFGIFDRGGKVFLQISTAARYFSRYTVCVTR